MSNFEVDEGGIYTCLECDWVGKRSGYYKHKKSKHNMEVSEKTQPVDDESTPATIELEESDTSAHVDTDTVEETSSDWLQWGGDDTVEEPSTHSMPTPLKAMKKKATKGKRNKRSAKELQSARATSKNLMVMGLGMSDVLMSAYGKGVTLDKDFEVVHKQSDKELVAESGVAYMEEKGIFLSDRISKGMVFTAMMGWYHIIPMNDIRKKAEKPFFKRGGGLLSKIPLIGRLFKKKPKKVDEQHTVEMYSNEQ